MSALGKMEFTKSNASSRIATPSDRKMSMKQRLLDMEANEKVKSESGLGTGSNTVEGSKQPPSPAAVIKMPTEPASPVGGEGKSVPRTRFGSISAIPNLEENRSPKESEKSPKMGEVVSAVNAKVAGTTKAVAMFKNY